MQQHTPKGAPAYYISEYDTSVRVYFFPNEHDTCISRIVCLSCNPNEINPLAKKDVFKFFEMSANDSLKGTDDYVVNVAPSIPFVLPYNKEASKDAISKCLELFEASLLHTRADPSQMRTVSTNDLRWALKNVGIQ